ncbi:MAG: hypothetical protein K6E94_02575 [Elusimicrobiaceae bacterium]|nr:hypothetical protein [Elusimicrobiaceae bacterium]
MAEEKIKEITAQNPAVFKQNLVAKNRAFIISWKETSISSARKLNRKTILYTKKTKTRNINKKISLHILFRNMEYEVLFILLEFMIISSTQINI